MANIVTARGDAQVKLEKREMLYEGSAKRLYQTDRSDVIIQEFKDEVTGSDGRKKTRIKNIGAFNAEISSYLFEYLEGFHIPTHFVRQLSECEILVKRLEIFPLELIVRNLAGGNLSTVYGLKEGTELPHPIIEHYWKSDSPNRPLVNEYHIFALGLATPEELRLLNRLSSKVNVVLKSFFSRRGMKLVDVTLEFGRHNGQILLGDELSPDTFHLWDCKTNRKLDIDSLRQDSDEARLVYEDIRNRVCARVA